MLNLWDIVVVAFVGWRVWRGWNRGFANEVFGLLAVVFGAICAVWLSATVEGILGKVIGHGNVTKLVALALAFAVIALCLIAVGGLVTKVLHAMFLGAVNRSLGAAFGVLSGFSIALVISLFLMAWDLGGFSKTVGASLSGHVAGGMAEAISAALPAKIVQQVKKSI